METSAEGRQATEFTSDYARDNLDAQANKKAEEAQIMNKDKLKKAHDRVFGKFQEHTINTSPRIGETFYACTNAKLHENESIAEDSWLRLIYVGTDKKVIKIKVLQDYLNGDKLKSSHSDILELPLNDNKQAFFDPQYAVEIRKTFLIAIIDEFGHIEITIKERNI